MNRRKFLSETGKIALATTVPFILPSGRIFALTETPLVEHVVFCLFAGGIRTWESIDKKEGNLMPNTLHGYESLSDDIKFGIEKVPKLSEQPLQLFGTLFKNFRYNSETTLHYNGHATAVTGNYCNTIELMKPIRHPSIFEYFNKHSPFGNKNLNSWWVSDQGGPFPYLQYSSHLKYGLKYAANMIEPNTLFKYPFGTLLDESREAKMKGLIDLLKFENTTPYSKIHSYINSPEDQVKIKNFVYATYEKHFREKVTLWDDIPDLTLNEDLINTFTACNIIREFHPRLLVVNMQDSDIGHSNFTEYLNNLHKADYALGKLWETIQSDATMKDKTVLIAAPEFGRNQSQNSIIDHFGRFAVDHTGDELSQQHFCLIAGPDNIVRQNHVSDQEGESIDIVPTIAHLLGIRKMITGDLLKGKILTDAFV